MDCPACGAAAPEGARFCPACGHGLAAPSDQRRVVTVLFADLVGYTSLSEDRDPEHVKNLVDRCFERLASDVTAFGGRVDKVVGDALLALFGAPVAHEDDAERAVRAALQMQRSLERYTREAGVEVRMRVGVNSGEVLAGALRAGDDYTVMGDVVNVASRLQAAAAPGQVVVGPATYAATRQIVRYEPLGPLEVRGRTELVEAWVALETVAPPGYRPRRFRTPLVGRDPELGVLRQAVAAAFARRRPHLLLISGETGVGKSRLAEELGAGASVTHDAATYVGRCVPYGEANPWWPVAEILRQALGIDLADPQPVSIEKCVAGVERATRLGGRDADAAEVRRIADGLLYLMGEEHALDGVEPARAVEEALRSLAAVIEGIASRHPVLLFLADLHWAEPSLLDLLDRLVGRLHDVPVAIVVTARPELSERFTPSPSRHHNLVSVHLDALDAAAAGQLVDALIAPSVPPEVRDLLHERSGGNPFFLEELAALLSESGVIGGGHAAGASPALGDLPATLRGIVAARLDRIEPGARALVEDAAVVGRVGPVAALASLAGDRGEDATAALDELVGRDLLSVQDGSFEFKSDLVREVAYETLTKAERARRHARLAEWLEGRARDTGREDEYLGQLAHHYATAARLARDLGGVEAVPADVRDRALGWLERAGARADQRDYYRDAAQLADEALDLLGDREHDARRVHLVRRAAARANLHLLDEAEADVATLLSTAGDGATRVRALTIRGAILTKRNDREGAVGAYQEAVALARQLGDGLLIADALRGLGMMHLFGWELDEADRCIGEALPWYRQVGDRRGEAWALQNLAWISFVGGDADAADERLVESERVFAELNDWGGLNFVWGLLGFVRHTQGRLDEARALAERVLPEARRSGDRWATGMTLVLHGSVSLWQGDTAHALEDALEALACFEGLDDVQGRFLAEVLRVRALAFLGRLDEARDLARSGVEAGSGLGIGTWRADVMAALNLAAAEGDVAAAEQVFSAIDWAGHPPAEAWVVKALVVAQAGRPDEALGTLERVVRGEHESTGPEDEGVRAFARSVLALVHAALGRSEDAVAAATPPGASGQGTFVDVVYAALGAGLAQARAGRRDEALERLQLALERADETDNRLVQAVARLAMGRGLEALGDPSASECLSQASARLQAMGAAGVGWDTLFRLAAGVGVASEPAPSGRGA